MTDHPSQTFELRAGVSNRNRWNPERPKSSDWQKVRKLVLARDDYTCMSCRHRASKLMNVHHVEDGEDNDPRNLAVMCVACHAVMHTGLNLQHGGIQIWRCTVEPILSQVEIVTATRQGIRAGKSLAEINAAFKLEQGKYAPDSMRWVNDLLYNMGPEPRAELPDPLRAVFVNFKQWQLDT